MPLHPPAQRSRPRNRRAPAPSPALASVLVLASLLAPTAADGAPKAPDDWSIERREWRGDLEPGKPVRLVNRHGDLRVRGTGEARVEVLAIAQRHRDDPRRYEIVATATATGDGGVAVEIRDTVEGGGEPPADPPDAWRKRRVDLTVLLPAASPLRLETERGIGQAKGLDAAVEAASETGDLQLSTAGPVVARTDHGRLHVELRGDVPTPPPHLETVTGEIRLQLPRGAAFRARVATRGEITTDYSIEIEKLPGSELKRGRVTFLGDGIRGDTGSDSSDPLPEIVLESERGAIALLESGS